jgi:hypothetical protein
MNFRYAILITCLLAHYAGAMELRPSPSASAGPYLPAELDLDADDIPAGADRLHVRWALGGPTVVIPLPSAGASATTYPLLLPPDGLVQDFTVTILTGDDVLYEQQVTVYWPADTTGPALVNPRWARPFDVQPPRWPAAFRGWMLLVLACTGGLIWLTCWVVPHLWRGTALIGIPLLATLLLAGMLHHQPTLFSRPSTAHPGVEVLSSLRAGQVHIPRRCVPVYVSRRDLIADNAVIAPDGTTVTLTPGRAVLLLDWPLTNYSPVPLAD